MTSRKDMDKSRAGEINRAMVSHALYSVGAIDHPESLTGVTLPDMLEATRIVEAANEPLPEGKRTLVCDQRMIAALYALHRYDAEKADGSAKAIITAPGRALICVQTEED